MLSLPLQLRVTIPFHSAQPFGERKKITAGMKNKKGSKSNGAQLRRKTLVMRHAMILNKRSSENGDPVFMRVREVMVGMVAFKNCKCSVVRCARRVFCIMVFLTERH